MELPMSSPSEPTTHADTNQLERDLMHRAAQMLANSDPQSLTAAAAVIVLTARPPCLYLPRLGPRRTTRGRGRIDRWIASAGGGRS